MKDSLEQILAVRSFEYGPTTIEIIVSIEKGVGRTTYGRARSSYRRKVRVEVSGGKYEDENNEIENETDCEIVVEPRIPHSVKMLSLWTELYGVLAPWKSVREMRDKKREEYDGEMVYPGPAVEVTKQVEETVRPVLEKVDLHYDLTGVDIDVDIDVTMEYLECETSLAEVDDEIESFTKSLESDGSSSV